MLDIQTLEGPVLIFGGPYSNYHATLAMREESVRLGIPLCNIICNGDLVAYCADPENTVNLIRNWGIHVVMGNCEESIASQQDDCGCGFEADTLCSTLSVEWYRYASTKVCGDNQRWMSTLPRTIRFDMGGKRFAVIHGGVEDISEFVFASSDSGKKRNDINRLEVDCVVGGHCGLPFGHDLGDQYWLNSGVIGMPANDGTRDGWYLLLQPIENEIVARWHRLPFDTGCAAAAMETAGLGSAYREALISGIWPSMDILPGKEQAGQGKYLTPAPLQIT